MSNEPSAKAKALDLLRTRMAQKQEVPTQSPTTTAETPEDELYYQFRRQNFFAVILNCINAGPIEDGVPTAGNVVVRSKRTGKQSAFDGIESIMGDVLTNVARELISASFLDVAQAQQVYAPSNPDLDGKLRETTKAYDRDAPSKSLVFFLKTGRKRLLFSTEGLRRKLGGMHKYAMERDDMERAANIELMSAAFENVLARYDIGELVGGEHRQDNLLPIQEVTQAVESGF